MIFNPVQVEIIRAVLYFDVFKYPLTIDELYENSAITTSRTQFINDLEDLLRASVLKQIDNYILAPERAATDIERRIKGNKGAEEIMPTAHKYSRIIASFPFVEGVLLSGALSKKYYDENGDIDFFIVTKPNRLWICRTLLILRYKLLPGNKKKFWCTNYFISSDDLQIEDVNIFTGTELAYLIPTVNYPIYKKLLQNNNWYKTRFPNKSEISGDNCDETPSPVLKRFSEAVFSGFWGNWIDNILLYLTLKNWRRKYPDMSNVDFDLQFRSRKNVCKRHTKGFQNKILKLWEEKQVSFENNFQVTLR